MSRYIDQQETLKKLQAYRPYQRLGEDAISYAIVTVDNMPTADVRENVKAKKVIGGDNSGRNEAVWWYECSACGGNVDISDDFCKHCGAEFVGGE